MSYITHRAIPPASTLSFSPTAATLLNATATGQALATTVAQTPASMSTQSNNQTTQNIIFGVFAIVLAFLAILIGWLQLWRFRPHNSNSDEETALDQPLYELLEV